MEVDHIFIFSDNKGGEAEDLIDLGLTEGSSRIHIGQGTTNRKFYFHNFFLELLWVSDEDEIKHPETRGTQLWERANYKQNGASRFGLCLVNTDATDELFEQAQVYQPSYFPAGMSIDILPNIDNSKLPWTFRLPYRGGKKAVDEPMDHANHMGMLTSVTFGVEELDAKSAYLNSFEIEKSIQFVQKSNTQLILEFDHGKQEKTYKHEGLDLIMRY